MIYCRWIKGKASTVHSRLLPATTTTDRATGRAAVAGYRRVISSGTAPRTTPPVTLAILRETYDPWERRSPLTPRHVRQLLQQRTNLRILVQPCQRRIFPAFDYAQAGAILTDDLSMADLIVGVKRPADETTLLSEKTYLFFSHTVKGQPENMSLLETCLEEHVQLIDYERLLEQPTPGSSTKPKRLVSFGRFAGLAGAMDGLHGLGRRFLAEGRSTPFLSCMPAVLCESLELAQERIQAVGQRVRLRGTGYERPLVLAVTAKGGCVHNGVMEIMDGLPHTVVPVDELAYLHATEKGIASQQQVYVVPVAMEDIFEKGQDGSYDRTDFQMHPNLYHSTMCAKVAPYSTALFNCAYWDDRFPRLLTKQDMQRLYQEDRKE
jgi:alpha-aminoadipic semialdehyde synthase